MVNPVKKKAVWQKVSTLVSVKTNYFAFIHHLGDVRPFRGWQGSRQGRGVFALKTINNPDRARCLARMI